MQSRELFEQTFTVASYESDFTGHLALHSLFDRFQEIAGHHATSLGVGFTRLREAGVAWMLSRVKVEIRELPRWGETVTLRTWPKGVDRLFALRDFRLSSKTGDVLVLATTCWLLVDLDKGRPRRIESLGVDLEFPRAEHAIREVPDKIAVPPGVSIAYEKAITVSELDVNEHVNNAQYVRWVVDCYTAAELHSGHVVSIQMNYLDQVRYGDKVVMGISKHSEPRGTHYVEGVLGATGEKAFQALVQWG